MEDAGARNPTDIASGQMNLLALPATRACRRNANGVLAIDSVDRNRKISVLRLEALQSDADLDLRACHDPLLYQRSLHRQSIHRRSTCSSVTSGRPDLAVGCGISESGPATMSVGRSTQCPGIGLGLLFGRVAFTPCTPLRYVSPLMVSLITCRL